MKDTIKYYHTIVHFENPSVSFCIDSKGIIILIYSFVINVKSTKCSARSGKKKEEAGINGERLLII